MEITRKQKVSHSDYASFRLEYENGGILSPLRFGQAFLNKFVPDISYPELYYEKDKHKAEAMIYAEFIKFDASK